MCSVADSRSHSSYHRSDSIDSDLIRDAHRVHCSSSSSSSNLYPSHPHTAPHPPGHVGVATPPMMSLPASGSNLNQHYSCSSSSMLPTKLPHAPNIKPLISIPLPSGPLTSNILDSLEEGSDSVSSVNTSSLPKSKEDPAPAINSSSVLGDYSDGQQQQLQKVMEKHRSQLSLLHDLSHLYNTSAKLGVMGRTAGNGSGQGSTLPLVPPSRGADHMATQQRGSGVGETSSRIVEHSQIFDYGNHSNLALEHVAARARDQAGGEVCRHGNEGMYRGQWP